MFFYHAKVNFSYNIWVIAPKQTVSSFLILISFENSPRFIATFIAKQSHNLCHAVGPNKTYKMYLGFKCYLGKSSRKIILKNVFGGLAM